MLPQHIKEPPQQAKLCPPPAHIRRTKGGGIICFISFVLIRKSVSNRSCKRWALSLLLYCVSFWSARETRPSSFWETPPSDWVLHCRYCSRGCTHWLSLCPPRDDTCCSSDFIKLSFQYGLLTHSNQRASVFFFFLLSNTFNIIRNMAAMDDKNLGFDDIKLVPWHWCNYFELWDVKSGLWTHTNEQQVHGFSREKQHPPFQWTIDSRCKADDRKVGLAQWGHGDPWSHTQETGNSHTKSQTERKQLINK